MAAQAARALSSRLENCRNLAPADRLAGLVAAADLVLLASGTATLETALLGTPMVVSYRLSALTFAIVRMLVRVDHIAMPNLILGRRAVPELIHPFALLAFV